jgi:anion-transporting  ArsA/GET3 family ATPase
MPGVADLLEGRKVCICAGSGGVGKTTTAAAIAAGMAARGKRVAVLTIDPAKRLADSLGLPELGNTERRVDPALFAELDVDPGEGELWAMMLDAKATFDEVVRRHAPDAETRDRILSNRIYQQLSAALAGSQEYMAMEKLFEVWAEDRYDLLVLDTPPSRNALDFLDAPRRLTQFIEGRALQVFMRPTGLATKVFGRGASMMFSVLRKITGVDLLQDLAEFFQAFSGMVGGFRERARRVNELLADDQTTFFVVCGPQGEPISEAVYFHRKLVEAKLPFGGVIVNRVHYEDGLREDAKALLPALVEVLGGQGSDDLVDRVIANYRDYQTLATRDRRNVRRLSRQMRTRAVIEVPYLDDDVHDLAGLMELNRYLFATGAEQRSQIAAGKA